ncbi:MAG: thiamine phosphate synthase [Candidatus Thermoplasmatota archaeon]|nr:thiamine phosphate synthase [Candidatus Thermoplasmatota archaeon]
MIICAITPGFRDESIFDKVKSALKGGIDILQYREKEANNMIAEKVAAKLNRMCREAGTQFYVDDRVDIAFRIGAYGVHVGKDDMPVGMIREKYKNLHIGGSAYCSPQLAVELQYQGCDYVAFGSMFHTETKKDYGLCTPEIIKQVRGKLNIPVLAIGGINTENAHIFKNLGYEGIAVSSAIFSSPDPETTVNSLRESIS